MKLPEFTVEHLEKLPLRAIVAFAARCARRVEPHAQLPEGHPQKESRRVAVEAALLIAEAFAKGSVTRPDESVVAAVDASQRVAGGAPGSEDATAAAAKAAHAALTAWHASFQHADEGGPEETHTPEARKFLGDLAHVTADLAALDAFTAALNAFVSVGLQNEDFVRAALGDYEALVKLKLGHYPDPGSPIDPTPGGPLGPL
jgi:hypothetical protein